MIDITHHQVAIPDLAEKAVGLKVMQLTDLHRSNITSDRHLKHAIALANRQSPDLMVLTGDYVSNKIADIAPVAAMLAELKAPLGVIAILGNHDHHTGGAAVAHALEQVGITVLRNQSKLLSNNIRVVGLDDDRYKHTNIPAAYREALPGENLIVLAHNPALVEKLPDRPALVLSGHTHGGQIHLPILTARELRRIGAKHYRAGWYRHGELQMYVSRGLGNVGIPLRLFCSPEIAEFTLV